MATGGASTSLYGHPDALSGSGGTPNQKRRALISTVIPGFLYLGAAQSACNLSEIERHCITRYLCCAEEVPTPRHLHGAGGASPSGIRSFRLPPTDWHSPEPEEQEEVPSPDAHRLSASFLRIPLRDRVDTELQEYFSEAFRFLRAAKRGNHRVLVFCQQGKSRSASVVIAYLIRYHHLSYEAALERVRSCRAEVDPNVAFCIQLSRLEGNPLESSAALASPNPAYLRVPALARLTVDTAPEDHSENLPEGLGHHVSKPGDPAIELPLPSRVYGMSQHGTSPIQPQLMENATPKMTVRGREERSLPSVKTPPNQTLPPAAAVRNPPPALSILHESCSPRALALAAASESISPTAGEHLADDSVLASTVNSLLSTRCDSAVLPLCLPIFPRQRASPGAGILAVGHGSPMQSPARAAVSLSDDDDEEALINPSFNETILVDLALGATVDGVGGESMLNDDDVVLLSTVNNYGGSP